MAQGTKFRQLDQKVGKLGFGQFIFLYFFSSNVDLNVYKKTMENLTKSQSIPHLNLTPQAPVYPEVEEINQIELKPMQEMH